MKYSLIFLFALFLTSCADFSKVKSDSQPISHDIWDDLLSKHVGLDGNVNYDGLIADSLQLNAYLAGISSNFPNNKNWNEAQQLAYWINAYNAYTVQLIIRNYPLESIKDIGSKVAVPFVNSVWDIKFFQIEGQEMDLNNIEHSILRKVYNEPRIHFAIVCASGSCPKLRPEAYTAEKLETQLQEQTVEFVNDASRNIIGEDKIQISKIFLWFKGDFTKEGSLISFLNRFSKVQISEEAEINHLDYDWSLNE